MQQYNELVLKVSNLKKHFPIKSSIPFKKPTQFVKAVDGVSFELYKGETLGIVGESGCGKSTVARLINQLISPTEGIVEFKGTDLASLNSKDIRSARKSIQMVFQNPYASLDPRKTIEYLIAEPLVIHGIGDEASRKKRVVELLETVGLSAYHAKRHPHEFSGGQRQRINIARALALNPDIVVCDEPVSALDVSVQAQVINLLKDLQKEFGLTYIFISHDLNVVNYMCDRIAVMYLGKIVEIGSYKEIYEKPQHPYTQALLSAIPKENPFDKKDRIILSGDVPSPVNPPSGCAFHKRCRFATEKCAEVQPTLDTVSATHQVSCHLFKLIQQEVSSI
ncbi:ABC transporter ATP-binding protein [Lysinibacillus capsici]|uniref:ABC transporter ATP-binding protein n=1 Tax=Lysinibacillus capsici TaxID=2115968 RepID=UPI00289EE2C9|nr:dipeptide ABC transporter ATP-binding protein [Lysinibacillus capsici]